MNIENIDDEFINDFNNLINTYDEYDEYRILVESILNICYDDLRKPKSDSNNHSNNHSNNNDDTIERSIYRYKRYLKFIKLDSDLCILLEKYIKSPEYNLMKKIDLHIYNLLQ